MVNFDKIKDVCDPVSIEQMDRFTTGGGDFIKFSVPGWTQSDLSFCKNEGSKNLKLMEKGVNWIENEGKIDTKCLKYVK